MFPKAHLTLQSRMFGSRWVITPLWLSGSWRSFLYSSVYFCHLLISSASVRSNCFCPLLCPSLHEMFLFIIGDWKAKVGSQETPGNRQVWPWSTKWSRAKANRVLPREHSGHNKHPLSTTQELLYTWTPPVGQYQNQIDYILFSWIRRSSIQLAKTNKRYQRNISCKDGHNKGQKQLDLTEAEDIKRWQECTELYKKRS